VQAGKSLLTSFSYKERNQLSTSFNLQPNVHAMFEIITCQIYLYATVLCELSTTYRLRRSNYREELSKLRSVEDINKDDENSSHQEKDKATILTIFAFLILTESHCVVLFSYQTYFDLPPSDCSRRLSLSFTGCLFNSTRVKVPLCEKCWCS
jgi:hypothetical protein